MPFTPEELEAMRLADPRPVRKRFPITDGYISAATLARCLCGERSKK